MEGWGGSNQSLYEKQATSTPTALNRRIQ